MIQPTDILALLDPIIEVRKKLKKGELPFTKQGEPIEYFPGYLEFCSWKNAVTNHTVKGKKPLDLIQKRAPNQSQEELQYTVDNFKQITLPVNFDFIATIGRGLHDGNWSIEYQEDATNIKAADMGFKKYLDVDMTKTPLKMSFDNYMKYVFPQTNINDSQGVVAYKPYREEVTVLDDEGNEVIAGDALPEPIPYYYSVERVLNDLDLGYALIETNRYSIVEKGNKPVREGVVYELYDDVNIWVIEQKGKAHEWQFAEPVLYFQHNLGFLPVKYMGGTAVYFYDGQLVYQSPFLTVTDILDDVLLDGCMLRGSKASCVYPQKVMIGNDCQFVDENHERCVNGSIWNKDHTAVYRCTECNGTGQTPRTGPTNTLFVKVKSSSDDGDGIKPTEALAYISPSVDTPKFMRDEIDKGIMSALAILHLKTTNTVVQGAEDMTATGMVMDEKAKYSFIKPIVDLNFEHREFGMKCMGGMRYRGDFKMPFINKPISYDFNSEADYLLQISTMQQANVPPAIISPYVYKYLQAIFYDNPRTAKAYDLIIAADRLFTMTKDQISSELPRNLIQPWEVVLHDSALTFVHDLERTDPKFLDQDMQAMIDQLVAHAQSKTPATQVAPRLNPATILANANN